MPRPKVSNRLLLIVVTPNDAIFFPKSDDAKNALFDPFCQKLLVVLFGVTAVSTKVVFSILFVLFSRVTRSWQL